MTDKTVSLILAFLYNNKIKIFSNIQVSKYEGRIPYDLISFCYSGFDIDIKVYNDTFIKVIVDNIPYDFCDDIQSLRRAITGLDNLVRDY